MQEIDNDDWLPPSLRKPPKPANITKFELILKLAERYPLLTQSDVAQAVNQILDEITTTLARGERVEIRGFGSFSLNYRKPRMARNPKTGEKVSVAGKSIPHFRPGKELRDRVNPDA